jgi:hypothetical protein
MDVIPLISEHLQRKKSTPNLLSYFCYQCLSNAFHECISLLIICIQTLSVYFWQNRQCKTSPVSPLPHPFHWYLSSIRFFLFGLGYILSQINFQIKSKSFTSFLYFFGTPHFSFKSRLCYQNTFNIEVLPLKVKFLVFQTWMQLFILFTILVQIYIY